eukprot:UN11878
MKIDDVLLFHFYDILMCLTHIMHPIQRRLWKVLILKYQRVVKTLEKVFRN